METQQQVCLLTLKGMRARTIASHLGMAASTAHVHLKNIRRAMGTRTDREAAEKAVRLGLIETDEEVRPRLTARECAYLHYALEGRSDEWIAARFEVSPNCVLHFRDSVCEKLGIEEPREAPQWVRDHIQERLHRLPLGPLPTRKREDKGLGEETLQVLRLRAQDLSYEDIAREAGISPPTVGHHMRRAKKVLGVSSPAEAVEEAKRRGLI